MKINKKQIKYNQMKLDESLFKNPMINRKFAESVLDGTSAVFSGDPEYRIEGFSYKSRGNILYNIRMISRKHHESIDVSLTPAEVLSLYHLTSSIKEGFATKYTLDGFDQNVAIEMVGGEKNSIAFSNGAAVFKAESESDDIFKEFLFLLNDIMISEPKTYRHMAEDPKFALGTFVGRSKRKDSPEHILDSKAFKHYLRVLGYTVNKVD